jgi:hypothetical protein
LASVRSIDCQAPFAVLNRIGAACASVVIVPSGFAHVVDVSDRNHSTADAVWARRSPIVDRSIELDELVENRELLDDELRLAPRVCRVLERQDLLDGSRSGCVRGCELLEVDRGAAAF